MQELLALAEQADSANVPEGMTLPEELKPRKDRLDAMAVAKAKIAEGAAKAKETGKKCAGRQGTTDPCVWGA